MAGLRFRAIARVRRLDAATLGRAAGPPWATSSSRPALRWTTGGGDPLTAWMRGHTGHYHHRDGEEEEKVFRLGLAAGKAVTRYFSGTTAVIADAAHSVCDVVRSGVALWSFRVARTPKDNEHPYGS